MGHSKAPSYTSGGLQEQERSASHVNANYQWKPKEKEWLMDFTLRDLMYIGVYVATVTGVMVRFKNQIQRLEKSMGTINRVIFLERGGLNVVTKDDCSSHRDTIQEQTQDAVDQIHCVNQNVVRIMRAMDLEPIVMKPGKIIKS